MIPFELARDDQKFDKKGRALTYRGNTIISFMNTEEWPIYSYIKEIQERLTETNFVHKIAFLPLDSLHMTIIPLLNETDRETDIWPSYIDEKTPFDEVDYMVYQKVKEISAFKSVKMKVRGINITGVHLEPIDKANAEKLKTYRNKITAVTKIKQEDHNDYNFHITFAYVINEFTEKERKEAQTISKLLSRDVIKSISEITVPEPYFTVFNDMTAYSTNLSFRKSLS